jgi:hypothetical protein
LAQLSLACLAAQKPIRSFCQHSAPTFKFGCWQSDATSARFRPLVGSICRTSSAEPRSQSTSASCSERAAPLFGQGRNGVRRFWPGKLVARPRVDLGRLARFGRWLTPHFCPPTGRSIIEIEQNYPAAEREPA